MKVHAFAGKATLVTQSAALDRAMSWARSGRRSDAAPGHEQFRDRSDSRLGAAAGLQRYSRLRATGCRLPGSAIVTAGGAPAIEHLSCRVERFATSAGAWRA